MKLVIAFKGRRVIVAFRGCTAYEFQVGHFVMRVVHLSTGGWFTWWAPWRRVSFRWYGEPI